MRRAPWLAVGLALTGCGNLLGIEVLSYDGGVDTGNPPDATGSDAPATHDGGADGPKGDSTTGDGSGGDGTTSGDTSSDVPATETGSETAAPESGLPEGGCSTGSSGCTGNAPWSCVGGNPVVGSPCSDQTCVSGACLGVCAPQQTQCNGTNTAFQSCQADGTWGTTATCTGPVNGAPTCNATTGCGSGTCDNASLPTLCNGTCVDTTNDGYNCGVCGQTCTGTTCSNGYCAVQPMCDGTGTATNTSNAARLGFQIGKTGGLQTVLYGYFGVAGSVYDCTLPATALSPVPAPGVELAVSAGVCSNYYNDPVSDKSQAYVFDLHGGDCHGSSLLLVQGGTDVSGATFGTLIADVANDDALYTLTDPTLELVTFATDPDSGTTTTASTPCITVSGTLGDGAAGGGHVVAVDTAGGVIRGATVSAGACGAATNLATGVTSENAVAVSYDGSTVAFENGSNLYVCPTSGCTAAELSTPYASGLGTIARNGLVFDASSPGALYWVGTAGLQRCSGVSAGGTCTPTLLVPGLATTSGVGVDATYVYYLQGMVLDRVPK